MDSRIAQAFGQVLRRLRTESRLSQEALAECANLSTSYISFLEHGRRTPTLGVLLSLASALRVTPESLVTATCALLR
jgi:transcriptional regulator with XRE-family HTH domain